MGKPGTERSSLPSKNFPCISMDMLQNGAFVLLGKLVKVIIGEGYITLIFKGTSILTFCSLT